LFERAARRDEIARLYLQILANREQIGLVRFEEADERSEQDRRICLITEHFRPDSGQIEEALGPPGFAERCGESREADGDGIDWSFVAHALGPVDWEAGK
jgi:hypothetical protein